MNIAGWMLYMLWAVFGLLWLDFLIGFMRSLVTGSFSSEMVLGYLKDVLYYVFPLIVLMNTMPLDPTGWVLFIAYFIGGLAVIWHYVIAIKNKF